MKGKSWKKKELQKELWYAFAAPKPQRREEFLRLLAERALVDERYGLHAENVAHPNRPLAGLPVFVLSQIAYIRKGIWWLSAMIFACACFLAASPGMAGDGAQDRVLWGIAALAPLLAMTVIAESGRSETWEMAELEMVTRFSLRSVVLARLGILGLENLVMLTLFVFVGRGGDPVGQEGGVLQTGLCILLPYLLTCFLGLWIVRRFRGQQAVYWCFGMAVCVSVMVFTIPDRIGYPEQERNLIWWAACTFMLGVGTVKQCIRFVGETAELSYCLHDHA